MTARKIPQMRERLGLSQREFARRLGVARVTVTRWENGTRRPSGIARLGIRAVLARDTRAWQDVSRAALNELWDNAEDAIYDDWRACYGA